MSTLFLNPDVTIEEMSKEQLAEFNKTAMRHYYYTLETETPENEQENPENEQNAPKLDDDGLANILNDLNDLFSGKEPSAQSDTEPKDTAAEGSENKIDEISESEAAENPDPQNWAESSDDDFFEDSEEMSESSESERSYRSDSENSYSSDNESSYSSDSDTYSSSSSDSDEDEREEEKGAEEKQDEEPKRKPRRTPLYFRPGMFKDSDSDEDEREEKKPRKVKTVIKGPESSESSEEEDFIPKKRKRPVNMFSSEDENEKPESSAKAPAESDEHGKPQNAETQEEREARQDRANLAAEHRALMQRGIGFDEFNSFRFDLDADMEDEHLKGMKFIQRLTGVRLNENSTYDDCIKALDKLIINGKSAYEYFGLANEPKDMTAIDNKVLPGLTKVMDHIFKGWDYESDSLETPFIFVKEDLRIEPLKLDVNQLTESGYADGFEINGIPSKRVLSKQEARQFVLDDCLSELGKDPNGGGITYSKGGVAEADRNELYRQFSALSYKYFEEKGDDGIESDIAYVANIKNMSNQQLLEEYYNRYIPVAMYCKEINGQLQPNAIFHVYDGVDGKITYETKNEGDRRRAVEKYVSQTKDGFVLSNIKQEIERRMYYVLDAKYGGEFGTAINYVMETNSENYNNYVSVGAFRKEGELLDTLRAQAEKYNETGDSYSRLLNNEIIDPDAKKELEDSVSTLPAFKFSFDELKDPATLMTALRSKDFGFENIHINGESIKDILKGVTGKEFDQMTDDDFKIISRGGVFREKIFNQFEKISHLDMCLDSATGKYNMPVITLKTDACELALQMTEGRKLEPLPKVDELPDWRKRISRQSTIDANAREVKTYSDSLSAANKRDRENESLDEVNNAIRVNTRLALDQMLSSADLFYARDNLNNPRSRQVQATNLSALQQRSTSFNNAPSALTQPTASNENENRLENNMSNN